MDAIFQPLDTSIYDDKTSGIKTVFLAALSGALLSLAIANPLFPNGFMFAAPVALVPLYIAILHCRNYGDAMRCSAVQALSVHLLSSYHLMFFRDFAVFTLGASALGTAGVASLFGALYFFPLRAARNSPCLPAPYDECRPLSAISYPLFFAIVYTLYDWYKAEGIGFLAYPWGTLPCAVSSFSSIMQAASLCGVWGISFLFSLSSAVIADAILLLPHCLTVASSETSWGKCRYLSTKCYTLTLSQPPFFCRPMSPTPSPLPPLHSALRTLSYASPAAVLCAVLFLCASIYGIIERGIVRNPIKQLTAVIVQQNSDPWVTNEEQNIIASERLTKEALDALAERGQKADVAVWSEGVLNYPFPRGFYRYSSFPKSCPLSAFIKQCHLPFVIGGSAEEAIPSISSDNAGDIPFTAHYNASALYDAQGVYQGYYAKLHLVPFAEVVPGVEYKTVRRIMKSVVGFSSGWAAGDKYTYFDIDAHKVSGAVQVFDATSSKSGNAGNTGNIIEEKSEKGEAADSIPVRISTPICFDDAFASVCRPLYLNGSEAFFNITDDSWSLTESAERQHLALARYRAIEYRTTLLRATNSGVSVVVNAAGDIIDSLPLFTPIAKAVTVPIYEHTLTPYAVLGDWLPLVCAIAAILSLIAASRFDTLRCGR